MEWWNSKTRLDNWYLLKKRKFPILLPKTENFTKLFIIEIHEQACYGGVSYTPLQLRHRYWLPQGRTAIKGILRICLKCIDYQGDPYKVRAIISFSKKYTHNDNDNDYFRPIYVKESMGMFLHLLCSACCTFGVSRRHTRRALPWRTRKVYSKKR